jgi:rhamnose transport system permease protein
MIVAWRVDPAFVSWEAQSLLASHLWETAIMAVPMTLVILIGGIDLSVGAILAVSAVALGLAFQHGLPPYAAAILSVIIGAFLGLANGWLITGLRAQPLIITLATLAAYRGIAEGISLAKPNSGFPATFLAFGSSSFAAIAFVVLAGTAAFILAKTPTGRAIYVMGHNETVARFSRLPVDRIKLILYGSSGAAAGLAGAIMVARRNTAKADLGAGIELDVITAVVLGGVSINGGKGGIFGLVLGLFLVHETREFVSWRWQKDEVVLIVIGLLLILSVLLQRSKTEDG